MEVFDMANKSSNSNDNKKQTKKSSGSGMWSLNKISFYTLCAVAVLYLLAIIFAAVKVAALATVASILQGIATAVMVCIVAVNAWRYVKSKQTIWKVLYFVVLLVVIVGIIIPLVL